MKKLIVILSLGLIGCNNYSSEAPPVEDGLVFRLLIESEDRIDASSCTEATLYRLPPTNQYNHRVQVGSLRYFEEANELKNCLRLSGLSNVYVLMYEDGVRTQMSEKLK